VPATPTTPHRPAWPAGCRAPSPRAAPLLDSCAQALAAAGGGILAALLLSVALAVVQWVVLKMLPFDNKSEFQLVVDMPAGTPLETPPPRCRNWAPTWPAARGA
jgi:hypothetical protein